MRRTLENVTDQEGEEENIRVENVREHRRERMLENMGEKTRT